jgi:hypothetical protein
MGDFAVEVDPDLRSREHEDRGRVVDRVLAETDRIQSEIAGWRDEPMTATWDTWSVLGDLGLPRTAAAVRACSAWLAGAVAQDARRRYPDDRTVRTAIAEIERLRDVAATKLNVALHRVIDEAQQLPGPSQRRELHRPERLVAYITSWFADTRYLDGNVTRARSLLDRWTDAIDELDRLGLELYHRLAAEAVSAWPAIGRSVEAADGFDPGDVAAWRDRAVRLTRVCNRARLDFDGRYDFAMRLGDTPIAGDFTPPIAAAIAEATRKTRRPIDEHAEWSLVAVVRGPGSINQRVNRAVPVPGARDKVELAVWEPTPCVQLEIIALHAGPVAMGPTVRV